MTIRVSIPGPRMREFCSTAPPKPGSITWGRADSRSPKHSPCESRVGTPSVTEVSLNADGTRPVLGSP
jgi:hypothetical protein